MDGALAAANQLYGKPCPPRPGFWRGSGNSSQSLSSLCPLAADQQARRPWTERDGRSPVTLYHLLLVCGKLRHTEGKGPAQEPKWARIHGSKLSGAFLIVTHVLSFGAGLGAQPLLIWAAVNHPLDGVGAENGGVPLRLKSKWVGGVGKGLQGW